MRYLAVLILLGTVCAGPRRVRLRFAKNDEQAVEIARTRGKLIFLTVIVDGDGENRAVIDQVFRDRSFQKIAKEFVLVYANKDDEHGQVVVKGPDGKKHRRCADCPSISCTAHMFLAMNWSRGFFPSTPARTPVHFVINANEEVVATIKNGSFEQGFSHVPAKEVVARLTKILAKHGRGLSEVQYKRIQQLKSDARAAKARGNLRLELEKQTAIVSFDKDVVDIREARKRIQEIDKIAAVALAKVDPLIEAKEWEKALDALEKIKEDFAGTLSAAGAARMRRELEDRKEVKRLVKASDLYAAGLKFMERKKIDIARKRFEKCVRLYSDTKYGPLSQAQLKTLAR